jgi:hypothetical protein
MEFSMRNYISYTAVAVALAAGTSVAHAQTIETVVVPPPATVIAQRPVVTVPAPVATAPVETVETVRTVTTTTTPARRVVRHVRNRVTTTRTTVSERMVSPAVAAMTRPSYTEVVGPGLYDVVAPAGVVGAAPMAPAYRYIYEPNRILVIDPYTGIAVQAIPR